MMFALARQIPAADASTQAGKWEKNRFMGVEITGKTLGVIGCGNIGSIVADARRRPEDEGHRLRSVPVGRARASSSASRRSSSTSCFRRADFITLHTPLTDKTRNIIDAAAIAKMKNGVRIINCARGGLVVEEDLAAALKRGKVAGAGVDVFDDGAGRRRARCSACDNVVCTPHLGASTTEAQENVALQVAEQMADYLINGAVSNALNMPSITAEEAPRLTPFVKLAEKLGSFAGQLTESRSRRSTSSIDGRRRRDEHARADQRGARRRCSGRMLRDVNMVSAPIDGAASAASSVDEIARDQRGAYEGYIRLTVTTEKQERSVAGTVLLRRQAALHPDQGHQPGGRARRRTCSTSPTRTSPASSAGSARCSATNGVNIANFNLGRDRAGRRRDRADRGRRADHRGRARQGRRRSKAWCRGSPSGVLDP